MHDLLRSLHVRCPKEDNILVRLDMYVTNEVSLFPWGSQVVKEWNFRKEVKGSNPGIPKILLLICDWPPLCALWKVWHRSLRWCSWTYFTIIQTIYTLINIYDQALCYSSILTLSSLFFQICNEICTQQLFTDICYG